MVMASFIHNLCDLTFQRCFHFLLSWTVWESTLIVTPRILAPFHLFLSVLSPVVTVLSFPLLSPIVRYSLMMSVAVWTSFLNTQNILNLRKHTDESKKVFEDGAVEEQTCDCKTELFVVVLVGAETPDDCV